MLKTELQDWLEELADDDELLGDIYSSTPLVKLTRDESDYLVVKLVGIGARATLRLMRPALNG